MNKQNGWCESLTPWWWLWWKAAPNKTSWFYLRVLKRFLQKRIFCFIFHCLHCLPWTRLWIRTHTACTDPWPWGSLDLQMFRSGWVAALCRSRMWEAEEGPSCSRFLQTVQVFPVLCHQSHLELVLLWRLDGTDNSASWSFMDLLIHSVACWIVELKKASSNSAIERFLLLVII